MYYGTDTRAFLLLMGILLALVWPWIQRLRQAVPLLELLGVAALVGTVLLFLQMHEFNPTLYRGGDLAAAFCFVVLLAAVAHPRTGIGEALGVAPLRWVGERSYGIYLWHWPIIVLVAGVNTRPSPGIVVAEAAPRPHGRRTVVQVRRAADPDGEPAAAARPAPTPLPARGRRRGRAGPRHSLRDPVRDAGVAEPGLELRQPAEGEGRDPPPEDDHDHRGSQQTGHKQKKQLSLPPGRILALGDSVMLGCSSQLKTALHHRVRVDATVGRQIEDTVNELQGLRRHHRLPKIVVLQVGNNGPLWYRDLVRLRHALHGIPDIVVVNVRNTTSWQDESNHALDNWLQGWRRRTSPTGTGARRARCCRTGRTPGRTAARSTRA